MNRAEEEKMKDKKKYNTEKILKRFERETKNLSQKERHKKANTYTVLILKADMANSQNHVETVLAEIEQSNQILSRAVMKNKTLREAIEFAKKEFVIEMSRKLSWEEMNMLFQMWSQRPRYRVVGTKIAGENRIKIQVVLPINNPGTDVSFRGEIIDGSKWFGDKKGITG